MAKRKKSKKSANTEKSFFDYVSDAVGDVVDGAWDNKWKLLAAVAVGYGVAKATESGEIRVSSESIDDPMDGFTASDHLSNTTGGDLLSH